MDTLTLSTTTLLRMFLLFFLTVTLELVVSFAAFDTPHYDIEQAEQLFEDFILTHGKTYSNQAEKEIRFNLFKNNLKTINEKNSIGGAVFDINHFSDLTREEIENRMGFRSPLGYYKDNCSIVTDNDVTTKNAPKAIDWQAKGAVTPIRDQGNCGSCFAFSTIGNIEGQYFIKQKELLSLSVQEIVDCSEENTGCDGGFMAAAMTDLIKLGGLESESNYPYEAKTESCRFNKSKIAIKLAGCTKYQLTDEDKLIEVVAKRGPLSIAVNGFEIAHYKKGILTEDHCSSSGFLTHAVLLVGYGTEKDTDFWLIKNSWGTKWGEKGYVRISRGENTCALMNENTASVDL